MAGSDLGSTARVKIRLGIAGKLGRAWVSVHGCMGVAGGWWAMHGLDSHKFIVLH